MHRDVEADINSWQKQQLSFDDLTTCGDPARLTSRLNWISTPPYICHYSYIRQRDLEEYS